SVRSRGREKIFSQVSERGIRSQLTPWENFCRTPIRRAAALSRPSIRSSAEPYECDALSKAKTFHRIRSSPHTEHEEHARRHVCRWIRWHGAAIPRYWSCNSARPPTL